MNGIFYLSLGINLLFILGILYLVINGRKHAERFFIERVIDVRHAQKSSMFRVCPPSRGGIVFLGNSITEGAHWNELFENRNILNRGIGGDIASGVLARMEEIIRHRPSKIFICIGTNDLARGIEISAVMANYRSIIRSVREGSPETKIYVQSVLPVGPKVLFGHKNDKILLLNDEIQKMCAEAAIPYIDLHREMKDENGTLRKQYTNDNLHLMGEAYLVWKDVIKAYIEE